MHRVDPRSDQEIVIAELNAPPRADSIHFDFDAFVEDSLTFMRGPRINVELEFDKATAAWAEDRVWHPSQQLTRLPGGKLQMTLTVADSRELVGWVLSFGKLRDL